MPDVSSLARLSSTLIGLYPSISDARSLAERAELNLGNIDMSGPPRVYMWNIVKEADKTMALGRLLAVGLEDYPDHPNLVLARDDDYGNLTSPVDEPSLSSDRWQPKLSNARAEKIMGSTSTFLPISFLAVGMNRARAVGRVLLSDLGTGTGFLVDGDLLVTNHHVIPDEAAARGARIQFNFQESERGTPEQIDEYVLDPDAAFATSPVDDGHDFTIVKVSGGPSEKWGSLPLSTTGVTVGSRVMIVQHPGGNFKKIALHNNLVTFANENILQYLTDTMPGSSGSPVFDQSWGVVGVHHAGGELAEPVSGRTVFRNEGIDIRRVVEVLEGLQRP